MKEKHEVTVTRRGGKFEFLGGMGFMVCVITCGLSVFGQVDAHHFGWAFLGLFPTLLVFIVGRCM